MSLSKDDVERIIENAITENLSIEIAGGEFTNPNGRTITLKYKDKEIYSASIDIRTRREYEG